MSAPAPGYPLTRDPTAVMGPRIGAWLVDFVLYMALATFLSPIGPLGEYHELDGLSGTEACDFLRDEGDAYGCFTLDDRIYFTDGGDAVIQFTVQLAFVILVFVIWQGLSGMTPGKALFGLRTVGEDGQVPGIGKAFLRTLLWIVDGIPYCIPGLVGFIAGVSSTGHRRVGDMAAKTFVVRKSDMGSPIQVPGLTSGYQAAGYGAPPGYGTPTTYPSPGGYPGAPGSGPWGATPPPAPPWGGEPRTPTSPPTDYRPAPPTTAPSPTPAPPEGAVSDFGAGLSPEPEVPTDATAEPPSATEAAEKTAEAEAEAEAEKAGDDKPEIETEVVSVPETEAPRVSESEGPLTGPEPAVPPPEGTRPEYNPQWDASRGTYIQWDANRSRWLQWDDTAKEWKPL